MVKIKKRTRAGAAFTELILEIFRFNGQLIQAGDVLTKELGLTSSLWQVFGDIQDKPSTMAQIARNMGLTRQSVRRSVKILEKKELVELIRNPDHRRAQLVIVTKKGKNLYKKVDDIQIYWSNGISKGIDDSEIKEAINLIRKIGSRLSLMFEN